MNRQWIMDLRPRQMRFIISKDIYKTLYIHDTLPIKFLPADFNGGFNHEFYSPEDDPQFGLLNWMTQTPNIKKVWMEPHKNRCFFLCFSWMPSYRHLPKAVAPGQDLAQDFRDQVWGFSLREWRVARGWSTIAYWAMYFLAEVSCDFLLVSFVIICRSSFRGGWFQTCPGKLVS